MINFTFYGIVNFFCSNVFIKRWCTPVTSLRGNLITEIYLYLVNIFSQNNYICLYGGVTFV